MHNKRTYAMLACAVMTWLTMPIFAADAGTNTITTKDVNVQVDRAKEEAKYESQSTTIITKEDIEKKQAKSLEDVIFSETGVTRTVDAMGRVGVAIRGADPRHTLMLIDGQPVMGSESKYMGGSDEAMRIGAENIERIEIIRGAATAKYGPDAIGGVINIITKAPSDHPTFQLNAEARYHDHEGTDENKNTWPTNFYMRADTGKVGNVKFSIFGSKREIMPVYSSERAYTTSNSVFFNNFKPSLRYYGDIKTTGASGEVELNENNKITFRVMQEKEDLERRNKSSQAGTIDAVIEPMQIFNRNMSRDTYALSYTGKNDKHDWKLDVNYGTMREDNVSFTTYYGGGYDAWSGQLNLATVDWLEHKQLDVNATMNTQVNDKHLLTYGIGYTKEQAEGTRLKNAPKTWGPTGKKIDPWSYSKNLHVTDGVADSDVHNWRFNSEDKGWNLEKDGLNWEREKEYNNGNSLTYDVGNGKTYTVTYSEVKENEQAILYDTIDKTSDFYKAYHQFSEEVSKQNASIYDSVSDYAGLAYFNLGMYKDTENSPYYYKNVKYNGAYYGQGYEERENRVSGGEAEIQKYHAFIQDTWQINDDTILTPVLRLDHSDLFGSHITANLGMTHNIKGNAHRRLKINAGTGYAEPGMGELYYNWEMYGNSGGSHYGWYWYGNPNLKPEKSVNFDISLEGENNKTYAKASVFHNVINDYMTSYFTGQLVDFYYGVSAATWATGDRIYSFKNIGKAEITGFEAEIQHRFNDKWSAKLGYAWLHAINKSDPDMPRTLLDRPQHKIDISFNYEDKKHGWKAALWGDYYIHMLDSNSISNVFRASDRDSEGNWAKKKADYQKKTFGIWNFMVEKQVNPDATVYIGVDNIFNYRDDDRAYADRTYRIGANIKFGYDAKAAAEKAAKKAAANAQGTAEPGAIDTTADNGTVIKNQGDWFLTRPSDKDAARKQGDVKLIGDYRVRSNMFGGQNTVGTNKLTTGSADDGATANFKDKPGHGLEQRLRLGVDAQLGDNTNLFVEGSSGNTVDTKYSKADKRGLHDTRLERVELNQKANKWDFTIGRLTEKMGATGYWFGKEYDGVRATWTGDKTQVRIGYGDFSKSTGITDSAYTHAEKGYFLRTPTLAELLGLKLNGSNLVVNQLASGDTYADNSLTNYAEKYANAGAGLDKNAPDYQVKLADAKLAVLQELNDILKNAGTNDAAYDSLTGWQSKGRQWYNQKFLTNTSKDNDYENIMGHYPGLIGLSGQTEKGKSVRLDKILSEMNSNNYDYSTISWGEVLDSTSGKEKLFNFFTSVCKEAQHYYSDTHNGETLQFKQSDGTYTKEITQDILNQMYIPFVGINSTQQTRGQKRIPDVKSNGQYGMIDRFMIILTRAGYEPSGNNTDIPLSNVIESIWTTGTLIKQDVVPAIDRAAFIQVRQKLNDNLGLTAWYLRSSGDEFHKTGMIETNGTWDTYSQDMNVANVFGLGAQWKLGASRLSFDWGVNRSETGRYFNGGRDAYGRYTGGGSNPTFWVLRADIGHADTDQPGSWNAFADYKYFQHGAFFGGNGTEALPDRYLDGIRSFTLGAGYVPAKNLLLEAFYTFGAKSTGQRDTLYGPESFTLGDYTRVQVSYKF